MNVSTVKTEHLLDVLKNEDEDNRLWFDYGPVRMTPSSIRVALVSKGGDESRVEPVIVIEVVPLNFLKTVPPGKELLSVGEFRKALDEALNEDDAKDVVVYVIQPSEVTNLRMLGLKKESGTTVIGTDVMDPALKILLAGGIALDALNIEERTVQ